MELGDMLQRGLGGGGGGERRLKGGGFYSQIGNMLRIGKQASGKWHCWRGVAQSFCFCRTQQPLTIGRVACSVALETTVQEILLVRHCVVL